MTPRPADGAAPASAAAAPAGVSPPQCRVCGSAEAQDLGPPVYRQPTTVAGVPIDVSDLNSRWFRCTACGYTYLHPTIPEQRLLECYGRASHGHWGTDRDFATARFYDAKAALLARSAPGKRVLDFGCFDGGFLAHLGSAYEKFGIEPATEAARAAEARGVHVVGRTAADANLPAAVDAVDAVVALDVFEHLNDPVGTLRDLAKMLVPGGVVMIESGNGDFRGIRRLGAAYLYLASVEHVGVFNESSLRLAARRAGLEMVQFQTSHHHVLPVRLLVTSPFVNAAWHVLRAWDRLRLPLPGKVRRIARGPYPRLTGADHFLAVLRKR